MINVIKKTVFTLFMTAAFLFGIAAQTDGETIQIPDWYDLSAKLSGVPEKDVALEVEIELKALIGSLINSKIRIIVPETWKTPEESKIINRVNQGQSTVLRFSVTPTTYLNQGSIIIEAELAVPVADLISHISKEFPQSAAEMSSKVKSWPALSKRYVDISFAIYPEESFSPIAGDMWLNYDDRLAPEKSFRGPVYLDDPMITTHQAQTDVEMFEKLEKYVKADPELAQKLQQSGIEIEKKRIDQIVALYVLGVRAYQSNELETARGFIESCEAAIASVKSDILQNIRIAAGNLKGLIFWAQGNKRLAEDAFKKAFYSNRKHPTQRYVLRNIGLLMLSNNDRSTAAEMYRLAQAFKNGFTLLKKESALIR